MSNLFENPKYVTEEISLGTDMYMFFRDKKLAKFNNSHYKIRGKLDCFLS